MLFSLEKERKGRKKKEEKEKEMESNLVYFPKKNKKGLSHFSQRCENSTFFIKAQLDSCLKFQSWVKTRKRQGIVQDR